MLASFLIMKVIHFGFFRIWWEDKDAFLGSRNKIAVAAKETADSSSKQSLKWSLREYRFCHLLYWEKEDEGVERRVQGV